MLKSSIYVKILSKHLNNDDIENNYDENENRSDGFDDEIDENKQNLMLMIMKKIMMNVLNPNH